MRTKTLLWLDDMRDPNNGLAFKYTPFGTNPIEIVWVKSYNEFVNYIDTNGLPDGICFDHDLGEEKTGYDCAKYLVNYCLDHNYSIPKYKIQSSNPVGVANIHSILQSYIKYQGD